MTSSLPQDLLVRLRRFIPPQRLVTDPLRCLAWGSDASFYRLVPQLVIVVENESEVQRVLALCAELSAPLTFRAAGTSPVSYTHLDVYKRQVP